MNTLASITSMSTLAYMTSLGTVASVTSIGAIGTVGIINKINESVDYVTQAIFITASSSFGYDAAITTAAILSASTTNKTYFLTDVIVSCTSGTVFTLVDSADTTRNRVFMANFDTAGGLVTNYSKPWVSTNSGNVLRFSTSSTAGGFITVSGYEI
jgi:hypothetical protein